MALPRGAARPAHTARTAAAAPQWGGHVAELLFLFVLQGTVPLHADGHEPQRLDRGDAFTVPGGLRHALADGSPTLELLEVTLPAVLATSG